MPAQNPQPIDPTFRRREIRRRRRRRRRMLRCLKLCSLLLVVAATAIGAMAIIREPEPEAVPEVPSVQQAAVTLPEPEPVPEPEPQYALHTTAATRTVPESFPSRYAVLVDLESGEILAEKNSETVINPASMSKILTLLVATELIGEDRLDGYFTMTREVADYCFSNKCSNVGYDVGEQIPVRELFYGCILCSGADACLGLAELACGSHEAFVEKMNEKVAELGLSDTAHFTNCVGIYDEDLHCTVRDMALILKAALENERCWEVLTTDVYFSEATDYHTQGQVLINEFLQRIQNQDTGAITVRSAKTGYVQQAGFCAASYGELEDGTAYICVTGSSTSTKQSIYDHAELYRTYCPTPETT